MVLNILFGDAQPRVSFGIHLLLEQQPNWKGGGCSGAARRCKLRLPRPGAAGLGITRNACPGATYRDTSSLPPPVGDLHEW